MSFTRRTEGEYVVYTGRTGMAEFEAALDVGMRRSFLESDTEPQMRRIEPLGTEQSQAMQDYLASVDNINELYNPGLIKELIEYSPPIKKVLPKIEELGFLNNVL